MDELMIFKHPEFGKLRTTEINGEPWVVGKDAAAALGYSNPRDALAKHVDREDKGVAKCDTLGGEQNLAIINESGLYSLILSSKLPSAKQFKRWVTAEVLPSIRRHGAYMTPSTIESVLTDPDTIIRLALNLRAERERRKAMEAEAHRDRRSPRLSAVSTIEDMPQTVFGQRLVALRKERHLTQGEMGKVIGRGRSTYSGYETEGKEPSFKTICFLACYFDVTTDYLLGLSDERN